jgi:diguanylate cyclase (GGDEF)-like protein
MAARPPAPLPRSEPPEPPDERARPHVVVADDDAVTRDLLASILRNGGYEVTALADGQEAVERVGKGGVDLVLLDALMPRLSGVEACRVIKAMTGGSGGVDRGPSGMTGLNAFVPVVLATVKTDPSSRVEGLKVGADDYVCKPFEEGEILARVKAMIRIKDLHDELAATRATLDRVSVHDELTGLHNYRYLHARLLEEFRRAERQHEPLACCVLDVDRLKGHNDRFGRAFGDAMLRGVAEVIRRSVRENDIVARYGGDEFLVVLPATHFAGSLSVAERIWRDVASIDWGAPGTPAAGARATISIGVALYPTRDVRAKDALLKAADAALLHAKREGANRICVFQQHGFIYTPTTAAPDRGPIKRSRSPYPARGARGTKG